MVVGNSPITFENARERFEVASCNIPEAPAFEGSGVVICAGGPYVPSAYVVVRLLRRLGVRLPIEIWHVGENEIPEWARRAFAPWDVDFHDVMLFYPNRPQSELQGWPIKTAALVNSKLRHTLFLDADCFPLRNPEFLFSSDEYKRLGALFWPDTKYHKMIEGAAIWSLTGLAYQGDKEFDAGIFVIDKQRCWRELCLAQWMNTQCSFWYDYVLGDKDTFYLAWRKLGAKFFLGPPGKRYYVVATRLFWKDGMPLVDHRAGTSKYGLPRRLGPFRIHLTPSYRPTTKNVYDELIQRFIVRDFALHVRFLEELGEVHDYHR
jgi:Mannosyltransferase putative